MAESQEDDFFAIYSQMGVDKFGHITFYGLLEKYFRIKSQKMKEEKKKI